MNTVLTRGIETFTLKLHVQRTWDEWLATYTNIPSSVITAYLLLTLDSPIAKVLAVIAVIVAVFENYYSFYLRMYPQSIRLVRDGLEVRNRGGTKVYPFSKIRSLKRNDSSQSFVIRFSNWRFISDFSEEDAEVFMTELSARSGVPIFPPRFA